MNNYLTTSINYFNTPNSPVLYTDKIKSSNTLNWKLLNTQPNPQYHLHTLHASFSLFTCASVTPKPVSSTTPSSSLFHHHSSPHNQTDSHHFYSFILTQFGSLIHQKTYHHLLPVALNTNTRFFHHHFHIHLHKKPNKKQIYYPPLLATAPTFS